MPSPISSTIEKLRQAMASLNDAYEHLSVVQAPDPEDLTDRFVRDYSIADQNDFVRAYSSSRANMATIQGAMVQHFSDAYPAGITSLFKNHPNNNRTTSCGEEVLSSRFCSLFEDLRNKSRTFTSLEQFQIHASEAEKHLTANRVDAAIFGFRRLIGAEDNLAHVSFEDKGQLFCQIHAHGLIAATLRLSRGPQYPMFAARWGSRLFEDQSLALRRAQQQKQGMSLLPHKTFELAFSSSYSCLKLLLSQEAGSDFEDPSFYRGYKLFGSLHGFLLRMHQLPLRSREESDLLTLWTNRFLKTHLKAEEAIKLVREDRLIHLSLPGFDPCVGSAQRENLSHKIKSELDPNATASKALLSLKWVELLRSDLTRTIRLKADNNTVHPGMRSGKIQNRTRCLTSTPGSGKSEAIKFVLSQFMRDSNAENAKALGWDAPLLCFHLDASELTGSFYNESALKVEKAFSDFRRISSEQGSVVVVFIDEVDRFLLGGSAVSSPEDNKVMVAFNRILDNTIAGNDLFFLCATNRFEEVSAPSRSRLAANRIHYETPARVRQSVSESLLDMLIDTDPAQARCVTSNGSEPEHTVLSGKDLNDFRPLIDSLLSTYTLRDICSLQGKLIGFKDIYPNASISKQFIDLVSGISNLEENLSDEAKQSGIPWSNWKTGTSTMERCEISSSGLKNEIDRIKGVIGSKTVRLSMRSGKEWCSALFLNAKGATILHAESYDGIDRPATRLSLKICSKRTLDYDIVEQVSSKTVEMPSGLAFFHIPLSELNLHNPKIDGVETDAIYSFTTYRSGPALPGENSSVASLFAED